MGPDSDESSYEKELGGQLLSSVSRSFYLTLKALPQELREPISLAYLLARTADTIADTAAAPTELRQNCLTQFDELIRSPDALKEAELVRRVEGGFRIHQDDPAEAKLMERVSEALAWLRTMRGNAAEAVQGVLKEIIAGQRLDIIRFPSDGVVRSLETAEELNDYTYRVAGCVGGFWTDLCCSELSDAFLSDVDLVRQKEAGVRMGKGLQLVNILRDIGKDYRLGRCYLPKVEWRAEGIEDEEDLLTKPERLDPLWERWRNVCGQHLNAGVDYVCQVENGKVRYATALPLMLAFRTLKRLENSGWEERLKGVKIPRLEVARLLPETLMASRSPKSLRAMADRIRGSEKY